MRFNGIRTVKTKNMKKIALLPLFLLCVSVYAQTEENEIKKVVNQRALAECKVVVSPNPSHGTIFVNAPNGSKCTVSSAKGTYIGTWSVADDGLRLEGLSTGTYVVMIKQEEQHVMRKFIVL